ncbi:hypothetical protein AVEN_115987-1 [Araneus ventricosus]|uniref:Secreted protein n=1 Tax=Araneus ventricosus TaxID=182803 RepID=A0A4Y2LYK8_ARAVE|nr:hypothetical protein AVEN_115987-1 [Araneus ventricosus]
MSRFSAIRGLFWTGLMILTRAQMTKTTPELAPFLSFRLTGDFMFTRPAYTVDRRSNCLSNLESPRADSETLPPGHSRFILLKSNCGSSYVSI